jgi:hypothetical protein
MNPLRDKLIALAAACLLIVAGGRHSLRADEHENPLPVHPDCADNQSPHVCTEVIAELKAELALFNQDFNPPNLEEIVKFYDKNVIHYVGSAGRWFRGRDDLRNNFFAPFVAQVASASLDFSPYHFRVISPNLVISYGAVPGVVHLKGGATLVQNPLPQTVTWVRNPDFDPKRPFVVLTDHE